MLAINLTEGSRLTAHLSGTSSPTMLITTLMHHKANLHQNKGQYIYTQSREKITVLISRFAPPQALANSPNMFTAKEK